VGERVVILIEEVFVEFAAGDDDRTVAGKVFHQRIFAWGERNVLPVQGNGTGGGVDDHFADFQKVRCLAAAAADEGADAGEQFLPVERFGEVVVRPGVESADAVGDRITR